MEETLERVFGMVRYLLLVAEYSFVLFVSRKVQVQGHSTRYAYMSPTTADTSKTDSMAHVV